MSVPMPAKKPATYADLEALPPHLSGEIINGVLYAQPRPVPKHILAAGSLNNELMGPFQKGRGGPGGWIFAEEPELHLGPHIVQPDMVGWRRERLPYLPKTKWIETSPDWVCELLSPSTEARDRTEKRLIYATYQVRHLWYIDPRTEVLEVFENRDGKWLLLSAFKGADLVTAPPFEAISFSLGELWPLGPEPEDGDTP
jgi:Uma2 family endonuclease